MTKHEASYTSFSSNNKAEIKGFRAPIIANKYLIFYLNFERKRKSLKSKAANYLLLFFYARITGLLIFL